MRERLVSPSVISKEDEALNRSLRPPTLAEYVGQARLREKLEIAIGAACRRGEAIERCACGMPTPARCYGP